MHIYLIERRDTIKYSEVSALVVTANNSTEARTLASRGSNGCEDHQLWMSAQFAHVTHIGEAGKGFQTAQVVLMDNVGS